MQHSIKCHVCTLEVPISSETVKKKVECPRCGTKLTVPQEILYTLTAERRETNLDNFEFKPPMEGPEYFKKNNSGHPTPSAGHAYKEKVKADTPQGCALLLVGLLILVSGFLNPFFFLLGIILMVWGGTVSHKKICSECGNKVEETSRMCPACKAMFDF